MNDGCSSLQSHIGLLHPFRRPTPAAWDDRYGVHHSPNSKATESSTQTAARGEARSGEPPKSPGVDPPGAHPRPYWTDHGRPPTCPPASSGRVRSGPPNREHRGGQSSCPRLPSRRTRPMSLPVRVGEPGHLYCRLPCPAACSAPTPPCRKRLLSDGKRCITELSVSNTSTGHESLNNCHE